MRYELVSRSVTIKGKVFRKTEKAILDDSKLGKSELESCYKSGFIKPIGTKAKNPAEVINQYKDDLKKEAKAKADADAKALKEAQEKEAKAKTDVKK